MTAAPLVRVGRVVDALLRATGSFAPGVGRAPIAHLASITCAAGLVYGAAMGTFGLRWLQVVYSSVKVPMLIGVSTLICLPNFYVINTVLGLRSDFAAACRGVLAAQATVALTLAALAPVTLTGYASTDDYPFATTLNGFAFLVAALAGQFTLARHYRELVRIDPRHRLARNVWLVLYVFVAIQLAWVLRPFIGDPGRATHFFRWNAWGNAYVEVVSIVGRVLRLR